MSVPLPDAKGIRPRTSARKGTKKNGPSRPAPRRACLTAIWRFGGAHSDSAVPQGLTRRKIQYRSHVCFAGPVAMARSPNPIPFRTRPLNSSAPMVLRLKTRESRTPPGLQNTHREPRPLRSPDRPTTGNSSSRPAANSSPPHDPSSGSHHNLPSAGWSSPVARQAHNLKAAGSNPAPATNISAPKKAPSVPTAGAFCVPGGRKRGGEGARCADGTLFRTSPASLMPKRILVRQKRPKVFVLSAASTPPR